mgnify:FL=1
MASEKIRVLLVTTWGVPCGIAEHSANLKQAVEAADLEIEIVPHDAWLDPALAIGEWDHHEDPAVPVVVHLNYQAALHSRWTPGTIRALGYPTLVTYHDTGVPNADHCKAIIDAADAAVVHEPCDDLPEGKTHYWRMGVPEYEGFGHVSVAAATRPYLGTVGFPFPWKNYDELCRVTATVGWGLCLIAPGATEDDQQRWRGLNPWVEIHPTFLPQDEVIRRLRGCDATAFCYVCHNTGQSGAILQGIAAGKSVFAFETCRQFRALHADPLGSLTINWGQTFEDLAYWLRHGVCPGHFDSGIIALREQESWRHLGKKYAALYRDLVSRSS